MRTIYKIFILQTLLLLPLLNVAQSPGSILRIRFSDGDPAIGASVYLSRSGKKQLFLSDPDGQVSLENLEMGSYQVRITMVGLVPQSFDLNIHANQSLYELTLPTKPAQSIEEISVESQSTKDQIETKGFAVNVVETQKAALQSLQTNELLDRSAGVRIRQDGGLGSHIHYNINGMTGNAVKIFIDGIPSTNFGPSFSLNSIPPALIDRIEIYKGVVPAYLSDDALGGAINILTKQNSRNAWSTSYSVGSFKTYQAALSGNYRDQSGFFSDFSAFYNYSDNDYSVWGEEITFRDYQGAVTPNQKARRFHDAFESYGAKLDLGWSDVKWADRFSIGGVFSQDYKEVQNGVTMQRVFGDRHSRRQGQVALLSYAKDDLLTDGLSLQVHAQYSWLHTQVIDTAGIMYDWRGPILYPDGRPVRYTGGAELGNRPTTVANGDQSLAVRTNLGYRIHQNHSIYFNFLFNSFKRDMEDAFLPQGLQLLENTRDLSKNISTLTYENLSFSGKLRSNVFYKFYQQTVTSIEPYQVTANPPQYAIDRIQKHEEYHGYGGAFSYALRPRLYILGSLEQAIRFPNEREIFGSPADAINPGNVQPEQSFNVNLGINLGTYTWAGIHHFRLNSSLFYRDTQGMIRQAITTGNSGTSYYENLEDVLSRGIDAEIIYDYRDRFNFTLNISKFDVLFNTRYNKEGAEYLYYRQQIRNEPSFKFNANASYQFPNLMKSSDRLVVHYHMGYVEGFLRNWSNVGLNHLDQIPTQFSNDLGFVYVFPYQKVSFSMDLKNMFNRQLYDNFGLQKPGRAFYSKIVYNF